MNTNRRNTKTTASSPRASRVATTKGLKKYNMDDWGKKGNDYGKKLAKEYDAKEKFGGNKFDKKDMNSYGEKWADKSGKEKKGKFEEWGQDQKWKTDKGKVGDGSSSKKV